MIEIQEEFYHGWMIQVAQASAGYTFRCCMPEQKACIVDAQFYLTPHHALRAGQLRADLESVRLSLTAFVRGRRQRLLLNADEQNALERSIVQYIDVAKHQFS